MPAFRPPEPPRLAVLISELGMGGMGKMRIQLMNSLVEQGLAVDLLYAKEKTTYSLETLDGRVRVFRLGTTNAVTGIPQLATYLLRRRPSVMLTQRLRVNLLAMRARDWTRAPTRIFASINTHLSRALEEFSPKTKQRRASRIRELYPRNDGLIAVSRGVADDLAGLLGWPSSAIHVAPNPVVTPDLDARAREPVEHPWLRPGEPPVILGAGRLAAQKDFPTLIRAFAAFRQHHRARLMILGQGPRKEELLSCAREAGIEDEVDLPGFTPNPYAYLAASRLFVLSSAWEGSPNVLIEAMAVGTPVVATDCPSGPREILRDGMLGPLVPVGDPEAMAEAMIHIWSAPPDTSPGRDWVRGHYSAACSARAFLKAMEAPKREPGSVRPAANPASPTGKGPGDPYLTETQRSPRKS